MYQKIRNRPSVRQLYQLQLEASHDITLEESEKLTNSLQQRLVDAFTRAYYTLRLHRQGTVILLTALRKGESWPLERMAADDPFLAPTLGRLAVSRGLG